MESRVKAFGHPIHPMLIVLPLGLLASAVIFDIVYLITGNAIFPTIAFYDITVGILGGLLAAAFGFIDWLAVPGGTRAKSVGAFHGLGNLTLVILFAISWFIRNGDPLHLPSTVALVFSFAGILLGLVTAWLGGEMVDRLGVGVDRGANVNAPSSLSGVPASVASAANPHVAAVPVTGRGMGESVDDQEQHDIHSPEDLPPDRTDHPGL